MSEHPAEKIHRKQPALALFLIVLVGAAVLQCGKTEERKIFTQSPLPYAEDALEPYISAMTLHFHYGRHHAAYVENANAMAARAGLSATTPQGVILAAAGKENHRGLFNNAAQAWNHDFFWKCLKPGGGTPPTGPLANKINAAFGTFQEFRSAFIEAAASVFGSGWTWLVLDGDNVRIINTHDADTPLVHGLAPLFAVDLWEHAYYLDYQNRREAYVASLLDHLVNWEFVAAQLPAGTGETASGPGH